MKVIVLWYYRDGSRSFAIRNLDVPDERFSIHQMIERFKSVDTPVYHYELFHLGNVMSVSELMDKIQSYPQHDPS